MKGRKKFYTTCFSKQKSVKCLTVGDGSVGKSCMIITNNTNTYPIDCKPTLSNKFEAVVKLNKNKILLELWDTSGLQDYQYFRRFSYQDTDVFLICFSIVDPKSFKNVKNYWKPEIDCFCPQDIIILVGTKLDLREDTATIKKLKEKGQEPITNEQGQMMANYIDAYTYLECSSVTKAGLNQVFDQVLNSVVERDSKTSTRSIC